MTRRIFDLIPFAFWLFAFALHCPAHAKAFHTDQENHTTLGSQPLPKPGATEMKTLKKPASSGTGSIAAKPKPLARPTSYSTGKGLIAAAHEALDSPQNSQTIGSIDEPALIADMGSTASETPLTLTTVPPDGTPPPGFQPPGRDEGYVINFSNVSIIEFMRFISKISSKNFVFDENDLQFAVSIISEGMTSEADVMAALLQILQIHGLSMLEQGNNLIIYQNANITKFSTLVTGDNSAPATAPLVTRVYRLGYLNPEKFAAIVQPLLSGQAIIEISTETHHLIITDITGTIDKVTELLRVLDQPNNVMQVACYQTQFHTPDVLLPLAQQVLSPIAASEGSEFLMVPQNETERIYIVSTPETIQRCMETLAMIDIGEPNNVVQVATYQTHNQSPETLIELASKILNPITSAANVTFDLVPQDEAKKIFIISTPNLIQHALETLTQLDVPNLPSSIVQVATYQTHHQHPDTLIQLASKILNPIAQAEGLTLDMVPQPEAEKIYIIATPGLIESALQTLAQLDVPSPRGPAPATPDAILVTSYDVRNQSPEALIGLAKRILAPLTPGNEDAAITMVPQDEAHKIYIIATAPLARTAIETLSQLDVENPTPIPPPPTDIAGTEFYVYKLEYMLGDQIQEAMAQIGASLSAPGQANQELLSCINSMQWIAATNTLLFNGTPRALDKVKELLAQLDVAPRQVFIEMLVVQTTLANSLNFGVEWGFQPNYNHHGNLQQYNGGFFSVPPLGSNPDFSPNFTVPNTVSTTGGGVSLPLSSGFNLGIIGNILTHNGNIFGTLGALLQALQTDSNTQVIMNPKLVTTDTNTASVFVGQNMPFTTSSTQITGAGSSTGFTVDYRDVGVYLEITPMLGSGDIVSLDVHQEINDNATNTTLTSSGTGTTSGFPIPTTNRTVTTTRVHIPDGYFLVISGMIKDSKVKTRSQMPCLGGLPLIGAAFSDRTTSNSKNNIIIFIHPRIIDTRDDLGQLTDEQGEEYRCKSSPDDLDSVWR